MRCNIQAAKRKMFVPVQHDFVPFAAYMLRNRIPKGGLPRWIFPD
jgi:hypothetical protein